MSCAHEVNKKIKKKNKENKIYIIQAAAPNIYKKNIVERKPEEILIKNIMIMIRLNISNFAKLVRLVICCYVVKEMR
jgi:hypothetical protein